MTNDFDAPEPEPLPDSGLFKTNPPSYLERAGLSPMRRVAIRWCRRHPEVARTLPGMNQALLDVLLREASPLPTDAPIV